MVGGMSEDATPRPRAVSPGRPLKATLASRWRHIMAVASAEFVDHGYAEANVARIAARAGVSKKTIYSRYGSKDELLVAVIGELAARCCEAIESAMTTAVDTPESTLTSFGMAAARNWIAADSVEFYRLVITETPRFPELATVYRNVMAGFAGTLAKYLRAQQQLGTLAFADPERAAYEFGLLAYGDIRERALLGDSVTEADIFSAVEAAVRIFLLDHGMSKPPR